MIFEALILGGAALLSTKNITNASKQTDSGNRLFDLKAELISGATGAIQHLSSLELSEEMRLEKAEKFYKIRQEFRVASNEKELFTAFNSFEDDVFDAQRSHNLNVNMRETLEKAATEAKEKARLEVLVVKEKKNEEERKARRTRLINRRKMYVGDLKVGSKYVITTRYRQFEGELLSIVDHWLDTELVFKNRSTQNINKFNWGDITEIEVFI